MLFDDLHELCGFSGIFGSARPSAYNRSRRYGLIYRIKILQSHPRTYINIRDSEQLPVGLLS